MEAVQIAQAAPTPSDAAPAAPVGLPSAAPAAPPLTTPAPAPVATPAAPGATVDAPAVPTAAAPAAQPAAAPAVQPAAVVAPAPATIAAQEAPGAEGPLVHEVEHSEGLLGAEVLLLLALAILIAIIWKPARNAVLTGLDSRAARIRHDLEEAKRLREEAQAALATYQRRQRNALEEAAAIVAHARQEAERLRTVAVADLEETLKRREVQAIDRIAQAEKAAAAEVRNIAVDVAISAARQLIADQLAKAKAGAGLIDSAIEDLPKRLH